MSNSEQLAPILVHPMWALWIVPSIITLSTISATITMLDTKISSLGELCSSEESPFPAIDAIPYIGTPWCAFSAFFRAAVATTWAKLFMSTFLGFILALICVKLVEASRKDEKLNRATRFPNALWMLVNLCSGALVVPLVMVPGSFHQSRIILLERRYSNARRIQTAQPTDNGIAEVNRPVEAAAKLSIPTSLLLGFIVPSVFLIFAPTPTTILVWQFFPLFVAFVSWGTIRLITIMGVCNVAGIESKTKTESLLFGLPFVVSMLAHAASVIYGLCKLVTGAIDNHPVLGLVPKAEDDLSWPAIKLLLVNFLAIYLSVLYWVYIEGGLETCAVGIKWTFIAGPGAGACKAWICRERVMQRLQIDGLNTSTAKSHIDNARDMTPDASSSNTPGEDPGERTALLETSPIRER